MKTYTDELTPLDSVTPLFTSANWMEREVGGVLGCIVTSGPMLPALSFVIHCLHYSDLIVKS